MVVTNKVVIHLLFAPDIMCRNEYIRRGSISHLSGLVQPENKRNKGHKRKIILLVSIIFSKPLCIYFSLLCASLNFYHVQVALDCQDVLRLSPGLITTENTITFGEFVCSGAFEAASKAASKEASKAASKGTSSLLQSPIFKASATCILSREDFSHPSVNRILF
jgi:hypothetical protein